jgi:hypothetical protein
MATTQHVVATQCSSAFVSLLFCSLSAESTRAMDQQGFFEALAALDPLFAVI